MEYLQAYLKTDSSAEKRDSACLILQPLLPSLLTASQSKGVQKLPLHLSPH